MKMNPSPKALLFKVVILSLMGMIAAKVVISTGVKMSMHK